jgi:hypothetical protein
MFFFGMKKIIKSFDYYYKIVEERWKMSEEWELKLFRKNQENLIPKSIIVTSSDSLGGISISYIQNKQNRQ